MDGSLIGIDATSVRHSLFRGRTAGLIGLRARTWPLMVPTVVPMWTTGTKTGRRRTNMLWTTSYGLGRSLGFAHRKRFASMGGRGMDRFLLCCRPGRSGGHASRVVVLRYLFWMPPCSGCRRPQPLLSYFLGFLSVKDLVGTLFSSHYVRSFVPERQSRARECPMGILGLKCTSSASSRG